MPCSQAGVRGLRGGGRRASSLGSVHNALVTACRGPDGGRARGAGGVTAGDPPPRAARRFPFLSPFPRPAARAWCHRQEPTARRRPPGGQRPVFPLHRHVESPLGSCRPRVGTVRVSGGAVPEGHRCGPCFVRAENTAPPPPAVGSVWPASPLLTDEETEAQRASDSPAG